MRRTIIYLITCIITLPAMAQNERSFRLNVGFEWGIVSLPAVRKNLFPPNDFSRSSGVNLCLERVLSSKHSLFAGLGWQASSLKLDAMVDAGNRISAAPDSIKYGSINQQVIGIPFGYRRWFGHSFVQLEGQVGYSFYNEYEARISRADKTRELSDVSRLVYSACIGLGSHLSCKEKDGWFYMIRLSYRLNPYFANTGASKLDPLQFSVAIGI